MLEQWGYQAMQEDDLEGQLAGELQPHHDHPGHPKEQYVVPRLQHAGGVKSGQVRGSLGVLRPAQGAEGPQARGEPGVQHILLLAQDNFWAKPAKNNRQFAVCAKLPKQLAC